MKKIWIYMAMPMTLLNGCQPRPVPVETAESTVIEEKSSIEESAITEENAPGNTSDDTSLEAGSIPNETSSSALETASETSISEAEFDGSTVSIVRSEKAKAEDITEEEIEAMVREAASDLSSVVQNGQTVVLKPNLVQMIVDSTGERLDEEVNGITTDWRVTKAVLKMVRELNPDGKVYIMEGSATGPTRKVMDYFHYTPDYMEGVDSFICLEEDCGAWQDFDAPEVVKVDLPDGLLHQSYYFNRILYEADVIISIPALKTSSGVVVTGGIKNVSIGTPPGNLYGKAPDNPSKLKMVSHKITDGDLDKWIYDYYRAKPVNYVIVDGLQGFQSGPVPMSHERKETDKMNMRIIMAGNDPIAVDTVCALVTGWDPESIGYLNMFRENMDAGRMEDIRVKGIGADELRRKFTLKKPGLGGIPLEDIEGPQVTAKAVRDGNFLEIHYETTENANRAEVYVDGYFQYSEKASEKGDIRLNIPGLESGEHEVTLVVYDRFLNKTVLAVG